ncbi:hypothetical protein D3C71_1083260 [compost metagenome]
MREFFSKYSLTLAMTGGFRFNYMPESLLVLEERAKEMFPKGHIFMGTTPLVLGFYIGEVIIRNIKGSYWHKDLSDNPRSWGIEVPLCSGGTISVFPAQRFINFSHDYSDTIYGYFNMLRDMNSGVLNIHTMDYYEGDHYIFKSYTKDLDDMQDSSDEDKERINSTLKEHNSNTRL